MDQATLDQIVNEFFLQYSPAEGIIPYRPSAQGRIIAVTSLNRADAQTVRRHYGTISPMSVLPFYTFPILLADYVPVVTVRNPVILPAKYRGCRVRYSPVDGHPPKRI